jgi:hypothetical protein
MFEGIDLMLSDMVEPIPQASRQLSETGGLDEFDQFIENVDFELESEFTKSFASPRIRPVGSMISFDWGGNRVGRIRADVYDSASPSQKAQYERELRKRVLGL